MILLTLGVEALARLMEPEAPPRDAAWLQFDLEEPAEADELSPTPAQNRSQTR